MQDAASCRWGWNAVLPGLLQTLTLQQAPQRALSVFLPVFPTDHLTPASRGVWRCSSKVCFHCGQRRRWAIKIDPVEETQRRHADVFRLKRLAHAVVLHTSHPLTAAFISTTQLLPGCLHLRCKVDGGSADGCNCNVSGAKVVEGGMGGGAQIPGRSVTAQHSLATRRTFGAFRSFPPPPLFSFSPFLFFI